MGVVVRRAARKPSTAGGLFATDFEATILPVGKTVYVVDDDPAILKAVKRLLKAHALDAEVFESAEDFNERADPRGALCLVLDIHMPRADAFGVLGFLRERPEIQMPVVILSGSMPPINVDQALRLGAAACFDKPAHFAGLITLVQTIHDRWLAK